MWYESYGWPATSPELLALVWELPVSKSWQLLCYPKTRLLRDECVWAIVYYYFTCIFVAPSEPLCTHEICLRLKYELFRNDFFYKSPLRLNALEPLAEASGVLEQTPRCSMLVSYSDTEHSRYFRAQ